MTGPTAATSGARGAGAESQIGHSRYEAHLGKAGGTRVTVKFDKDFTVTGIGTGGPGGGRGPPVSAAFP